MTRTAHGYTLCPSSPSVTLTYTTQTCDEFYRPAIPPFRNYKSVSLLHRQRSGAWPQDCSAKQPLLSSIVTGEPPRALRCGCIRVQYTDVAAGVALEGAPADSACKDGWDTL